MNAPTHDIAWIDGGVSHIGTDRPEIPRDGEAPPRYVRLRPYGMSRTTVTNAQFAAFVEATGYVSQAHQIGWSFVFRGLLPDADGPQPPGLPWWSRLCGATWDQPLGSGSSWTMKADHPVVHVSLTDAMAYSKWAGGRLPSEAEWEHAARGGAEAKRYPWGDAEPDDDTVFCNIWQGQFPSNNTVADGFYGTSPAQCFTPNAFGIYNMSGNVWEWCSDRFRVRSLSKDAKARNQAAKQENERVLKGGSFLCHASYCWRYRIAARSGRAADTAASHVSFRVAFDGSH